jgi:hypothetical protein
MLHGRTRSGIWKSITVAKLHQLLSQLDGADLLECNDIGNILIFRGQQSDINNVQPIGYIDIASEAIDEITHA